MFEKIILMDGNAGLPEDGIYLHGFYESGKHVSIQIRQTDLPDLPDAGRLIVNNFLIDLRSPEETQIVAQLRDAECSEHPSPSPPGEIDYAPGPITGARALANLRDRMLDYLESQTYVENATNGVQDTRPMWKRFH